MTVERSKEDEAFERRLENFVNAGLRHLVDQAANDNHVDFVEVLSDSRRANVVKARRQIALALRAAPYRKSYPEIGALFERDHTTIVSLVGDRVPRPSEKLERLAKAIAEARAAMRCV